MRMIWVQLAGGVLLLACMVFAVAEFESADQWAHAWLPFVAAGALLTFFGAVASPRGSERKTWRHPTPPADA